MDAPRTLQEAILYFADYANCHAAVIAVRWPDGVVKCPRCGSNGSAIWRTPACGNATRSIRSRSSRSRSAPSLRIRRSPLQKWLPGALAAHQLQERHQQLRTRRARSASLRKPRGSCCRVCVSRCRTEDGGKLGGEVEVDETYIGGKARNMHADEARAAQRQARPLHGWQGRRHGLAGAPRQGRTQPASAPKCSTGSQAAHVQGTSARTSKPARPSTPTRSRPTSASSADYVHNVIDHAECYVDGQRPHQRHGELLDAPEARHQGHLRERRTVSSVPLPR